MGTPEARGGGGFRGANSIEFVGTPDAVASQMGEATDEIGGDGWLVQNLYINRRYVAEICDGLVPELQAPRAHPDDVRACALQGQPQGILTVPVAPVR